MSDKTRNSLMLAATTSYVEKIKNFAEELKIEFTEYQQMCVVNAVRTVNPLIVKKGLTWQSFTVDNIISELQKAAFLEVNTSAIPSECFYIIRNEKQKDGSWLPVLEFGIEGAGNDKILRKFGQDVAELKSYIVYEGDEFTEGFLDGWDMTLPKYKRMFKTNKPEKVVYLIKKTNGEIDVQYADTSDVMKSLLANAKQNMMNAIEVNENKTLREIAKHTLYEILEDDIWLDKTITKKGYQNKPNYQAPLFNPSYTSPISMYNMIERKLRNHATRKYPKNFNHKEVSTLYEDTFDEKYNVKSELISAEEKMEITNEEIDKNAGTKDVFEKEVVVVTEPVVKVKTEDRPTLVVKEEVIKEVVEPINTEKIVVGSPAKTIEKPIINNEQFGGESQETSDDDTPGWMK